MVAKVAIENSWARKIKLIKRHACALYLAGKMKSSYFLTTTYNEIFIDFLRFYWILRCFSKFLSILNNNFQVYCNELLLYAVGSCKERRFIVSSRLWSWGNKFIHVVNSIFYLVFIDTVRKTASKRHYFNEKSKHKC